MLASNSGHQVLIHNIRVRTKDLTDSFHNTIQYIYRSCHDGNIQVRSMLAAETY